MTIASEIQDLQTNLQAAKSAVTTKGGTVTDSGLAGLATEIASIPSGGGESDPEFGEVVLYGYTVSETVIDNVSSGFTVTVQNEERLKQAVDITMYELPIVVSVNGDDFSFSDEWTIEATDNNEMPVPELGDPFVFNEIFSVSAVPEPSGSFSFEFTLETIGGIEIDTTTTTKRTLTSITEFNKLAGTADFILDNVPKLALKEVKIGYNIVSTPNAFLYNCENIDTLSFSKNSSVTTIGNLFGRRIGFNSGGVEEIKIPEGVTSIGNDFLPATKINGMVTLPESLLTIGRAFMNGAIISCPIIIPSRVSTIGDNFLTGSSIEAPVKFLGVPTSIGTHFMFECGNMTSTVYLGNVPSTAFATSNNTLSVTINTRPAYQIGIPIKGAYSSSFVARFANRTSSPYRKLIDRGAN